MSKKFNYDKICLNCNKGYTSKEGVFNQKYCCKECKQEYYNKSVIDKVINPKKEDKNINKCLNCNTIIENNKYFCTDKCKEDFWNSNWRDKIKTCRRCKEEYCLEIFKCKNVKPYKTDKIKKKSKEINKTCIYCGNIFTTINKKQLCCSGKCRALHLKDLSKKRNLLKGYKYNKVCNYCGNEFKTNTNNDKYCSKECEEKYRNEWKNKIRVCPNCNIKFTSDKINTRFCSKECSVDYNKQQNIKKQKDKNKDIINRECLCCKNNFEIKNKNQKFCSNECRGNYYKKDKIQNIIKENNIKEYNKSYSLPPFNNNFNDINSSFNGKTINYWLLGGFNDELKEAIKDRDGWKCYICERETNLHVHHIIPRIEGGTHHPSNLITLCRGCHKSIENGDLENAIFKCIQRALRQR